MMELFDLLDAAPPVVLPTVLLMIAFGVLAIIEMLGRQGEN